MRRLLLLPLFLASFACSPELSGSECEGERCDQEDREGGIGNLCADRRQDVFNPNQMAFTDTSIRWSCQDAPGIDEADKGQEYCESFAIVELPSSGNSVIVGQQESDDTPFEWSEKYIDLSNEDYSELERMAWEEPDAEAGACIFSSWQSDIYDPLPVCLEDGLSECNSYRGMPLTGDNFRMRHPVNSLFAAENLVYDCLQTYASVSGFDGRPIYDPFTRGCFLNQLINRTSYRMSDTTVCTAALRLTECNCTPKNTERDFPEVLGALDQRGFHLGSWDDRKSPPPGCHYIETGDVVADGAVKPENLVACPLTAGEVLDHASADSGQLDLQSYCNEKYADNVVVHVLLSKAIMECKPEESTSGFADTCTDRPWVLEP